ncbi:MAG: hypothetical protein LBK60_02475 [Verrucomicrobiales bacterium]|jgi:hypothetical protein|nr:hypothetical protein [Verrucomicrobiales bacterium]
MNRINGDDKARAAKKPGQIESVAALVAGAEALRRELAENWTSMRQAWRCAPASLSSWRGHVRRKAGYLRVLETLRWGCL